VCLEVWFLRLLEPCLLLKVHERSINDEHMKPGVASPAKSRGVWSPHHTRQCMAMQKARFHRFGMREEHDGSWLVYDIFTGMPVVVSGQQMIGFRKEISRQLTSMLNVHDVFRRMCLGM
jgi:hypothetical protein